MTLDLILQMTGLYACIAIGYVAARRLEVEGKGISKLLFYVIVPLVFAHGISVMQLQQQYLVLPVIIFSISCTLCLLHYAIARRVYHDKSANILAFASGNGNNGYFGIPVALMLFSPEVVAVYMVMIIGVILYETTLGYYITTKGDFTLKQALRNMATLPMLHGALLGVFLSAMQWPMPHFTESFFVAIRGTYTILGMMMVGIGLAGVTSWKFDWRFIGMAFTVKFIAWPLMVGGFVLLDKMVLGWFLPEIHSAMFLLATMPLAVNAVIFATLLDAEPEKMATAVFLSTFFALIYVPLMIGVV